MNSHADNPQQRLKTTAVAHDAWAQFLEMPEAGGSARVDTHTLVSARTFQQVGQAAHGLVRPVRLAAARPYLR